MIKNKIVHVCVAVALLVPGILFIAGDTTLPMHALSAGRSGAEWMQGDISSVVVSYAVLPVLYVVLPVFSFLFGCMAYSRSWQFAPSAFSMMMKTLYLSLLSGAVLVSRHEVGVISLVWLSSSLAGAFSLRAVAIFADDREKTQG